jgi:hypothetical protein
MNVALALQYLAALFTLPSQAQSYANILAIAAVAGLDATAFIDGEPTERWVYMMSAVSSTCSSVAQQTIAASFLDLATDPGDPGDLSPDQTPRPGFLSALGEGWYGTTRSGRTLSVVVMVNAPGAEAGRGDAIIDTVVRWALDRS